MAKRVKELIILSQRGVQLATPYLKIMLAYAKVELVPPKLSELPAVKTGIVNLVKAAKAGHYKEVTVHEAFINSLVALEIWCWFFVGECIGKRNVTGYDV